MMLALKILGAVVALGVGIWLGQPGRYTQSVEEIETKMASGTARRRKTKRHFTPMAWMQRQVSTRPAHTRSGFRVKSPEDR